MSDMGGQEDEKGVSSTVEALALFDKLKHGCRGVRAMQRFNTWMVLDL